MYVLRSAEASDLESLYTLSRLMNFINLPADKDIIAKKIESSLNAFKKPSKDLNKNHYLFVLEDFLERKVIGCSMIHAQHGTEEEPHFFLKVGRENKFSETINTGFIHGTLKLGLDTSGPTEIGGLVLHPDYRGSFEKLGKQLSFIRFLYMGLHLENFKEEILSELMPPFDSNGQSPLWEAIGRRFLNMEYHDADILSRSNKEFILSLFPSDTIYEVLLPMEARNSIGRVGDETKPVKKMLEDIGFSYAHEVDPFDGGPHFKAKLAELSPIKNTIHCTVENTDTLDEAKAEYFLMTLPAKFHPFAAIRTQGILTGNKLQIKTDSLKGTDIEFPFKSAITKL